MCLPQYFQICDDIWIYWLLTNSMFHFHHQNLQISLDSLHGQKTNKQNIGTLCINLEKTNRNCTSLKQTGSHDSILWRIRTPHHPCSKFTTKLHSAKNLHLHINHKIFELSDTQSLPYVYQFSDKLQSWFPQPEMFCSGLNLPRAFCVFELISRGYGMHWGDLWGRGSRPSCAQ